MRITTAATLALTVLLATATLGAVAATPSVPSSPVERSQSSVSPLSPALERSPAVSPASTAPPPSERPATWQVIEIHVTDDGDAKWTVESRFLVTNDSDAETFNEYADALRSGEQEAPYKQLFAQYVAHASQSTSREMSMENAGWDEPRIQRIETETDGSTDGDEVRVGIISYSFTWTNFATVEGDRIHAGDALQTDDGPLIHTLADGQRLVITPPDNYGFVDAPTGTENGALVWNGPHQFDSDGLEITILRGAGPQPFSGWSLLIGVFLGLTVLVATGSYLLARRGVTIDRLPSLGLLAALGFADRSDQHGRQDRRPPAPESDGGSEMEAGVTAESPQSDETEEGTHLEFEESTDDVDPELLSDEERVLRLLKRNGGRMKQASIVSETGWSNAKVSQLLSKMDDDEEIEKLRIGRENLITLPGVDPTEID